MAGATRARQNNNKKYRTATFSVPEVYVETRTTASQCPISPMVPQYSRDRDRLRTAYETHVCVLITSNIWYRTSLRSQVRFQARRCTRNLQALRSQETTAPIASSTHLFRCSLSHEQNARSRLRHQAQSEPRRLPSRAARMVVRVNPDVWEKTV